jgi:hypothetical protein
MSARRIWQLSQTYPATSSEAATPTPPPPAERGATRGIACPTIAAGAVGREGIGPAAAATVCIDARGAREVKEWRLTATAQVTTNSIVASIEILLQE